VPEDLVDRSFVDEHTSGADQVMAVQREIDVPACAEQCGVDEALLRGALDLVVVIDVALTVQDVVLVEFRRVERSHRYDVLVRVPLADGQR
jgi:anaerobic selenocysteine-containing dehydrogenase